MHFELEADVFELTEYNVPSNTLLASGMHFDVFKLTEYYVPSNTLLAPAWI